MSRDASVELAWSDWRIWSFSELLHGVSIATEPFPRLTGRFRCRSCRPSFSSSPLSWRLPRVIPEIRRRRRFARSPVDTARRCSRRRGSCRPTSTATGPRQRSDRSARRSRGKVNSQRAMTSARSRDAVPHDFLMMRDAACARARHTSSRSPARASLVERCRLRSPRARMCLDAMA
jgi:hypothetical protein